MAYVEDKDLGLEEIISDLKELSRYEIKVGIQSGESTEDGASLAEIAAYNEYGTDRIPSRPFLRTAINDHDNWNEQRDRAVNIVIDGAKPMQAAGLIGQLAETGIKESILDGDWTPNAPSTIAKKGSSNPLIDKGRLLASIRYKVGYGD